MIRLGLDVLESVVFRRRSGFEASTLWFDLAVAPFYVAALAMVFCGPVPTSAGVAHLKAGRSSCLRAFRDNHRSADDAAGSHNVVVRVNAAVRDSRHHGRRFPWMIESCEDGRSWAQPRHPVARLARSGGIEYAATAECLAVDVLVRYIAAEHRENPEHLLRRWLRATVWDLDLATSTNPAQPPYDPPDRAGIAPHRYGQYLAVHHAEPVAVVIRTPHQVRAVVRHIAEHPGATLTIRERPG
ncbi:hypothetical protein [Saccharothrix sp.]|uniref:hypothetical protein n=1 Tax=Saccharothrix sp. TaxID=1873460 RepID=UPI0028118D82|nr:hypothetical protein [Saccharothrix sp.]